MLTPLVQESGSSYSDGTEWISGFHAAPVDSVNGEVGVVVLDSDDIGEVQLTFTVSGLLQLVASTNWW